MSVSTKIYVLLFFLFIMEGTVFAQRLEKGSVLSLKTERCANFSMEFISLHGMSENDFGDYERDWFKDKPSVVAMFLEFANRELGNTLRLGYCPDAKYTVKAIVNSISAKGNFLCDLVVVDTLETEIAKIVDIKEDGGTFGSKLNLIKDGAKHTGKKFGLVLSSFIRKAK